MRQRLFIMLLCLVLCVNVQAQDIDVVKRYCESLSTWSANKNISSLQTMENLVSVSPRFRIGNKLMTELASRNELSQTDTYRWDNYISCLQKEVDKGIRTSFSNIKAVPEDYIDKKYPGLQYVSCKVNITGSLSLELNDLFILKNGRIVKIADYVETTDEATGKKKIKIDYLDLARSAFADKDYAKCYNLYKEGGLKRIHQIEKGYRKDREMFIFSDGEGRDLIFPFVESCIALGKWDEVLTGITDYFPGSNGRIIRINKYEWTLNPEDIEKWNMEKAPLMDYFLKQTYMHYCSSINEIKESPVINHVTKCRNISVDQLMKDAATYFWNKINDSYGKSNIFLSAAAELGHLKAQKKLGKLYLTGRKQGFSSETIIPDTIKALRWFEQAAAQGDVESANVAAHFYLSGHGVPYNLPKAFSLYNMNASKNDYDSEYGLGLCYYYGFGVERSPQTALQHLKEAEVRHADIPYLIGSLYYMDNYNPKALSYFNRALKRPNLDNSVRSSILKTLSDCNRYGRCGLPVNMAEADRLLREAGKIVEADSKNIEDHFVSLTQISLDHETD